MLVREGGIASLNELSSAILMMRGSVEEEPARSAHAFAAARAAIEAESAMANPRFVIRRDDRRIVVAKNQSLGDYAMRLGETADELAAQDPLVPPGRALDQLRAIHLPTDEQPLPDSRLLRVAAGASATAAISSRQEVYPRGMEPDRALKLSQGALLGVRRLTIEDLKGRVIGRYPESQPLPDRPQLDQLLKSVGFDFVWDQTIRPRGAYKLRTRNYLVTSDATSQLQRSHTDLAELTTEITPEIAQARQFEERIQRGLENGTFIAMTVEPRGYMRAVDELQSRFEIQVVNVEAELINQLHDIAASKKVKWERVLQADSEPNSEDWNRLMKLVRVAIPKVEETILSADRLVLLTYSGLIARYEQMDMLTRIREQVGRTSRVPGLWMLIATDEQSAMPIMDGKAIPVIGPAEWARIPDSWLRNEHRSNGSRLETAAQ